MLGMKPERGKTAGLSEELREQECGPGPRVLGARPSLFS